MAIEQVMDKKGKYVYDWPRPMVATDAAVFGFFADKAKRRKPSWRLLLVKRKYGPFKGKWCLPGGFVNLDEELETAAARELAEETGLAGVPLEQIQTFGKVDRDPRGRVITVAFVGTVDEKQKRIKAGDDAAKARWFDIENLPKDWAFDIKKVVRFIVEKFKKSKIYRSKVKQQ